MYSIYRTTSIRHVAFAVVLLAFLGTLSFAQAAWSVTLAWDANPEPDIAGYRVSYGTTSGIYTQQIDVGNTTNAAISDLAGNETYFFVVTAYNTAGLESLPSNELSFAQPNQPPSVSLTSPVPGAAFTAPATVTIAATASDSDGTVARVEFYSGNVKVGETTASPFSYVWSSVPAGTYSLTARAYDDQGLVSASSPVKFSVTTVTQAPVARDDSVALDEGTSATIDVLSNDSDPDSGPNALRIQNVGSPANGSTSIAEDRVIYTPNPGFFGTDTFSYTITDGALTGTANVTLNVQSTAKANNLSEAGLIGSDVGTASGGSRVLSDNSWEIAGSGIGAAGLEDGMHFESTRQTGDFQAIVRIQSLSSEGALAEAGLMLREDPSADARFALLAATPAGYSYSSRSIAGESASRTLTATQALFPNAWVLIERIGDTINLATSTDGVTFDSAGSTTIASLAPEVEVGLSVSSGTPGVSARAVVTDFAIIELASKVQIAGHIIGASSGSSRILPDETWEISGAGNGFSGNSDDLYFECAEFEGDFQVVTRVNSFAEANSNGRAGLMVRESNGSGARLVAIGATSSSQYSSIVRTVTDGSASEFTPTAPFNAYTPTNAWMKLERRGDVLAVAVSADGVTWNEVTVVELTGLSTTVQVGAFVASGMPPKEATAGFTDFEILGF